VFPYVNPVNPLAIIISPFNTVFRSDWRWVMVLSIYGMLSFNRRIGSMPFLLKSSLSYSQLGVFALSAYPYSLKLIWSPIVDATYFPSIGRRKSWIIPMQIIIGTTLLWIGVNAEYIMDHVSNFVHFPTLLNYTRLAARNKGLPTDRCFQPPSLSLCYSRLVLFASAKDR
jgi:hypothetical protein